MTLTGILRFEKLPAEDSQLGKWQNARQRNEIAFIDAKNIAFYQIVHNSNWIFNLTIIFWFCSIAHLKVNCFAFKWICLNASNENVKWEWTVNCFTVWCYRTTNHRICLCLVIFQCVRVPVCMYLCILYVAARASVIVLVHFTWEFFFLAYRPIDQYYTN